MSYRLEIEIPGLPKLPNELLRRSWHVVTKEKNHWLNQVGLMTIGKKPLTPLKKANISCTRYSSKAPDYDGLTLSFKFPVDALVSLGILEDDSLDHIGVPTFTWERAPEKHGKIKIVVESL